MGRAFTFNVTGDNYTQLDAMDCGSTRLRMVAEFNGRSYSRQTLREQNFITRQGVSIQEKQPKLS